MEMNKILSLILGNWKQITHPPYLFFCPPSILLFPLHSSLCALHNKTEDKQKPFAKWVGYLFPVTLGMVLLLTACTHSPPIKPDALPRNDYSYLKNYLTWMIEGKMEEQNIEGLSIAIIDDQKIVWSQGFGYADTANAIKATPETIYRTGSISKLFTDTLVMQLAEQGKLDIDKPLKRYLPNFAIKTRFPDANAITPRNIMTHHSGLPSDVNNGMWTENPESFDQLVGLIKDEYVAYPPNTILAYSNLGITLLGSMLQEVTGDDFNIYAKQRLLNPLGMMDAYFSTALQGKLASKAYDNHEEKNEIPIRDIPAGGLNANVLDLSRFIQMVLAKGQSNGLQILKPETIKEMLRQQNISNTSGFDDSNWLRLVFTR